MRYTTCYILLLCLLTLSACKDTKPETDNPKTEQTKPTRPALKVPAFNSDSAYAYVAAQLAFGTRVPGTPTHKQTKEWLATELKRHGAKVIVQDFKPTLADGSKPASYNIIGQFNPKASERLLLAAHWDSRFVGDYDPDENRRKEPIMGADDGGSGVGVLLEIARNLNTLPADFGVDIIFFDAEDQGQSDVQDSWALGAQHWSRNIHRSGYSPKYGILLDMVGAKNARFPKEGYSMRFAPSVVNKVWKLAHAMGFGNYFDMVQDPGGVTDDHLYVNTIAKIPMIDIIHKPIQSQTGFGPHWHTHADDLSVIDKRTLRAAGQVVLAVVFKEASGQI